jgi:uncharacterized membrane protein HdeD (DUF308 family)
MSSTALDTTTGLDTPKHPWWLTLIQGITALVLGAILLWAPAKDKVDTWQVLVAFLGIYWLILGFLDIVRIFQDNTGWIWKLFMGIISIMAGGYILMYPAASAVVLPQVFVLVLGIWGLIYGAMLIFIGFRGAGWGAIIMGVLGAIFGLILVLNYAEPGWGLSMLWSAAVAGVIGGILLIVRAFQERSVAASAAA